MPIQVIEPRRLYVQIADQIRGLIASGEFPSGNRLPAERELAKRFGVSRPSMREALIALEVEGYVDVRPGSGIIVTAAKAAESDCSGDEGPLEILRARRIIEGEIAAETAPGMKQKEIAELEQILLRMDVANDTETRLLADRDFHLCIAAKLANKVLMRVVTELFDQRDNSLPRQFAVHFDSPKTWKAVLNEHHKVMAAFVARNPELARTAMREHLRKAHDRWAREM
jgi:GntR family transcriptional repressor for pyruvate dehydrogenase complex